MTGPVVALVLLVLPAAACGASGTWERSWGKDVVSGGETGAEVCTSAASCQAGSSAGALGGDFFAVTGIAADSAGNVYVADESHQRIDKFTATGKWLRSWGEDVVEGGGAKFEICTEAAKCKSGISETGEGGAFAAPAAVATGPNERVYVVDFGLDRVQVFDSQGNFIAAWGKNVIAPGGGTGYEVCEKGSECQMGEIGFLGGEFFLPAGVATDAEGNVYVSDLPSNRVQKFSSTGAFLEAWGLDVVSGNLETGYEQCTSAPACQMGAMGLGQGGAILAPQGIAVAGNKVFVGETLGSRVEEFTTEGAWVRAWGRDVVSGAGSEEFEVCETASSCKAAKEPSEGKAGSFAGGPPGVAADSAGHVYTTDTTQNRIQVFSASTGQFEAAWGKNAISGGGGGYEVCTVASECAAAESGGLGGELSEPFGLAVDSGGNLFVADFGNNRIDRFSDSPPKEEEEGDGGGGPTGGGPPAGGSSADAKGPGLSVSRKAKQHVGKLSVTVTGDEAGTLKCQAVVPVPGGKKAKSKSASSGIRVGEKVTLRLRFAGKALRSIKEALKSGKHLKAKITVVGQDTAGNSSTRKTSVKLLP